MIMIIIIIIIIIVIIIIIIIIKIRNCINLSNETVPKLAKAATTQNSK